MNCLSAELRSFGGLLAAVLFLTPTLALAVGDQAVTESVVQEARAKNLADRNEWRKIVHYRKTLFGWEAEADGVGFYVHPEGKTNPQAELEATLRGFFSTEKRKPEGFAMPAQTVRCQFPARWEWLNRELSLDQRIPKEDCEEFEKFRKRMAAQSATLIFSSYHMNSPSSAYGHSLLRLNKTATPQSSDHQQLLDTGLNYAALPNTTNPVWYAISGLAGLFPGAFSTMPYYYKVREYSDYESRDLWEYNLNLTQEEVDRLVAHAWELGSTTFSYYYLTENCSYHMLTLLEVAVPRANLVDRIPFWVIPSDTIKAIMDEPGLVKNVHYRPSLNTQFTARLARLDRNEQRVLKRITKSRNRDEVSLILDPARQGEILDAYIDFIDLNFADQLMTKDPEVSEWKQQTLIARSRLPTSDPLKISTPDDAPHMSHGSARLSVYRNESPRQGGSTGVSMRFALQDLTEVSTGLPPDSEIEFFDFHGRWWDREKTLRLEDFTLFEVATFAPLSDYNMRPSWRFRLGADRIYDPRCSNCTAGSLVTGGGGTVQILGSPRTTAFLLADLAVQGSGSFEESRISLLAGPSLGLRTELHKRVIWLNEARYRRAFSQPQFDERQLESRIRLTSPSLAWALELRGEWGRFDEEVTLGLAHYF